MDKISRILPAFLVLMAVVVGISCVNSGATGSKDDKLDFESSESVSGSENGANGSENGAGGDEKKLYPAPKAITDVKLKALDDEQFKIGDFKGKVVLINLWATWCTPCIEEMPYFNKLHKKFGDDGLVIVGLNSDEETDDQVKRFVAQQDLVYKIGWADAGLVREFFKISKLPGIPQSLLINRKGEMVGMFRGGGPRVISKMVRSIEKEMDAEDSVLEDNTGEGEESAKPDSDQMDKAIDADSEKGEKGDKKKK